MSLQIMQVRQFAIILLNSAALLELGCSCTAEGTGKNSSPPSTNQSTKEAVTSWNSAMAAKIDWNLTVIPIAGTENPKRRGDVIFIHGLMGDPHTTWESAEDPKFFMPAWLHEKMPDIAVWSIRYDAFMSEWSGDVMAVEDRSQNLLRELRAEKIGDKAVVFVAHSLGGIIVKQMLHDADTLNSPELQPIAKRTRGVIFLATPHSGSEEANLLRIVNQRFPSLRKSELVDQLKDDQSALRSLNTWYRQNVDRLKIKTLSFRENKKTGPFLIVDPSSAEPGLTGSIVVPVDHDHLSICKPKSKDDLVCKDTAKFIDEHLNAGVPSDLALADFMKEFSDVREVPKDLLTFKQKLLNKQFTWDVYIVQVIADPKKPAYRVGPTVDTQYNDTIYASFAPDAFQLQLDKNARIRLRGVFSEGTNVAGAMLHECEILEILGN